MSDINAVVVSVYNWYIHCTTKSHQMAAYLSIWLMYPFCNRDFTIL